MDRYFTMVSLPIPVPQRARPGTDTPQCGDRLPAVGDLQVSDQERRAVQTGDDPDGNWTHQMPEFDNRFARAGIFPSPLGRRHEFPLIPQVLAVDLQFEGMQRELQWATTGQSDGHILALDLAAGGQI